MRHWWLIFSLLIGLSLGQLRHAEGQSPVQVADPRVSYTFGETLTIETEVNSEATIQQVQIHLLPEGNMQQIIAEAALTPEGILTYSLDLSTAPFTVFAPVDYWFTFTLENGESVASRRFTFTYADNRFDWQSLETDEFAVYWYQGDSALGGTILNTAYEGLARIRLQVELPDLEKVTYYVYASAAELQATLPFNGPSAGLVAGHATPAANRVLVSIPPGPSQALEIKRQIPHELAHVLLYQKLGEDYNRLPSWLSEGLASSVELFPNPDYPLLLDKAYQREMILPMNALCESFPVDAANFQLAYAQSASFTWYLLTQYGAEGINALLNAYAEGFGCERAPEVALGRPLTQLESEWRQVTFDESPLRTALEGMLPWLLIAGVFILPLTGFYLGKSLLQRPLWRKRSETQP